MIDERKNTSHPTGDEVLLQAKKIDAADPLGTFRSEFYFPRNSDGTNKLYFCGNSLGLQHHSVPAAVEEVLCAWRERAVEGHFTGDRPWVKYQDALCQGQAVLVGVDPVDIVTMNTLTVNLHLALVSFYRPQGRRQRILIEKQAFPSDRYAVESQIRWHGLDPAECLVELAPHDGERLLSEDQIEDYLRHHGDSVALVLWPGVQYATGQVFDLTRIAAAARGCGASVGFDLAHSIGNVPVQLTQSGCDFAAWCTYKYLNAGPGAIAGMYVHQRHHKRTDLPRFNGWFGNDLASRFRMAAEFSPAPGADAWQLSTPPILSMAPLLASLAVFEQAGFDRLRQKSLAMTAWLAERIVADLADVLQIITPLQPERRGCQLCLRVLAGRDAGRDLFTCLESAGAVPDWREPDVVRVTPVPLYNNYEDCARLVRMMRRWADLSSPPR
ncbi:MAG TPA: kynureninase [Xanthomonadales bacterium]|nr:kynureninase [Xanthomonadales bacterium]